MDKSVPKSKKSRDGQETVNGDILDDKGEEMAADNADDEVKTSNRDAEVTENSDSSTDPKSKTDKDPVSSVKAEVGIGDGTAPVNATAAGLTFENERFGKTIVKFSNSIRLKHYSDGDSGKPFDDDDDKGLEDCRTMLEMLARVPTVIALVCLKVREEGLWRNQNYDSCLKCLCAWLNLKEGAVKRYLTAGLIIAFLIRERGIAGLPTAIAPYCILAKLKFENIILDTYDKAKAKADKDDGVITEKIVVDAVGGYKKVAPLAARKPRKTAKETKTEESEDSSASVPEAPEWKVDRNRQAIVKHVETVLNPVIEEYLSSENRKPENIRKIVASLEATLKLLEAALKRKHAA